MCVSECVRACAAVPGETVRPVERETVRPVERETVRPVERESVGRYIKNASPLKVTRF